MKLTDQNIALAFRVPLQILGIGGTAYSLDRTADAVVDRVRSGLCAQSHRGGLRPAVRAQGPARRICRVRHRGAAALGLQGSHRGPRAGGAGRHLLARTKRAPRRAWTKSSSATSRASSNRSCRCRAAAAIPAAPGMPGAPPQPPGGRAASCRSRRKPEKPTGRAARGKSITAKDYQRCRCQRSQKPPRPRRRIMTEATLDALRDALGQVISSAPQAVGRASAS